MNEDARIQLNVRVSKETIQQLDEIVEYYQQNTKVGRIYKGDVLTDIIESHIKLWKSKSIKQTKKIKITLWSCIFSVVFRVNYNARNEYVLSF
ncbi:hypothetical protein KHA80_21775 [Anaerobacillus sp. HL2]|nr:hypothetical protein KHA80_21775 [Anaerobacillus sp. HL2]